MASSVAHTAGPRRIATLPDHRAHLFVDQMRELGWNEGADYVIVKSGVFFGALLPDDEERAARRALAQQPDLILALTGDFALAAAQRLTASVPIVMISSGYPVEDGLALSLAHPGKNVTGNSQYAGTGVWGKLIEFLT